MRAARPVPSSSGASWGRLAVLPPLACLVLVAAPATAGAAAVGTSVPGTSDVGTSAVVRSADGAVAVAALDPLWPSQALPWQAARVPDAWPLVPAAARAVVAVLDTGVDTGHPDLSGAVVGQYDATTGGSDVTDHDGHGTFVAGVIAARAGNGIGIAGVATGVSLLAVKVSDAQGMETPAAVAAGIRWAADHGADVINASLGSTTFDPAVAAAVAYAIGRGVVVVAAAGNLGQSVPAFYPASSPGVVAVAATTVDGVARAGFSSYGNWITLGAPGDQLWSTTPTAGSTRYPAGYATDHGASFATAVVSGTAGMMRAVAPSLPPAVVASTLQSTASPRPGQHLGAGLVDAAAAVAAVAPGAGPTPPAVLAVASARIGAGVGAAAFSPNADGRRDTLPVAVTVPAEALGKRGRLAAGWQLQWSVRTAKGAAITGARAVRPKGRHVVIRWDGVGISGGVVPNGRYLVRVVLRHRVDGVSHRAVTVVPVVVDTRAPRARAVQGAGATVYPRRGTGALLGVTTNEAATMRVDVRAGGRLVRRLSATGATPGRLSVHFDGNGRGGRALPAGRYTWQVRLVDAAGNLTTTRLFVVRVSAAAAPNGQQQKEAA
ncbi:MAG: hypothetical protein EPO13_07250 [Actinomycetota bacterium]|nr:MAG: hypothetical protein EPO13_07250 [Actinomycetota bacterium]